MSVDPTRVVNQFLCVRVAELAQAQLSWKVQGGQCPSIANLRSSLQWLLGIFNISHHSHLKHDWI